MGRILGIDTSNYTTSAAILDTVTGEIRQEKTMIPVRTGERGVRQNDAVFHHVRQLPPLIETLLGTLCGEKIDAVGVSVRPRNIGGSYMPCFLAGVSGARMIASSYGCARYETSHQIGHLLAALYSANAYGLLGREFLAFHVSGGTTDLLYCRPDRDTLFAVHTAGTTLDLKAGQAIDRVGVRLGLTFPCGAAMEKLAMKSTRTDYMRPTLRGLDCCLSGLENRCIQMQDQGEEPCDIAAYCLYSVAYTISAMVDAAYQKYGEMPILFCGGVMSNRLIRPLLENGREAYFADPAYSADNAAGVALYGAYKHEGGFSWQC